MPFRNRYLTVSLFSAGAACIVSVIVLLLAPAKIELALYWMQFGCSLSALGCATDCVRRGKEALFLQLQAGAIGCFTLGLIFWVAHLSILGYDDETISISDLSCIGFYLFLLSAVIGILNPETRNPCQKYIRFKITALIAPVTVIVSGVLEALFVIQSNFGNISFVVLYTAVFTPLSYFTLKFLIVPADDNPRIKAMKPYTFVIFSILVMNMIWNISNFLTHGNTVFSVCVLITSILLLLIVPTAYGGYKKWKNC
ncbi:MAG: hypothetical protein GX424_09675 [Clostridiales bacterium]|nr:hypothetical protein [Clostridiales bacterium]